MAWLRSEQSLLNHPKTTHLHVLLKVDRDVVIGRLHRLWWWCLDYALDGDLSKHGSKVIEKACDIPLSVLIRCKFVDVHPYRRIHDWWGNQGAYLRSRFHKDPEKWQRIDKLYKRDLDISKDTSKDMSKHSPRICPVERTDVENGRTDGTDVRTYEDVKEVRAVALGASPRAPAPVGDANDFDFGGTDKPRNPFELDHWEFKLSHVEKIQTKLREAGYGKVEVRK